MIYNSEFIKSRHAELLAEASRIRLAKSAIKRRGRNAR